MLARELAMALCPSVSVTSPCAIERDGQTDLVFGMEASLDQSYSMFQGNSRIYKIRYFSLELFPKPRTQKISSRQVDGVVKKTRKTRRRSSSKWLTVDASWLFSARRSTVILVFVVKAKPVY